MTAPPDVKTYVDALAASVTAEVLTLHSLMLREVLPTSPTTPATQQRTSCQFDYFDDAVAYLFQVRFRKSVVLEYRVHCGEPREQKLPQLLRVNLDLTATDEPKNRS